MEDILYEIDPNGIITANGVILIMEESNPAYQLYVEFLVNGGTVIETQVITPFTPSEFINLKG
jgi:hypothetical protein